MKILSVYPKTQRIGSELLLVKFDWNNEGVYGLAVTGPENDRDFVIFARIQLGIFDGIITPPIYTRRHGEIWK